MTVTQLRPRWSEFSIQEWSRLNRLAENAEPVLRLAYTQAVSNGREVDRLSLQSAVIKTVVKTCRTTADVYGLVFNPNSPTYGALVDELVDVYIKGIHSPNAKEEVRRILPTDITLGERGERLNTFGLDAKSAVALERYRQERGTEGDYRTDIFIRRQNLIVTRGNLIAATEANRVVNGAVEALWLDNTAVSKALPDDVTYYDRSIQDIGALPRNAVKELITRRDGNVCNYCEPIDGVTAPIGGQFETERGYFRYPPIHPRCRCFLIVKLRGR